MNTIKQQAIALIEEMPDESMDTVLSQLQFMRRVIEGIEQADRGETVSHEEAKERLAHWLQSAGR